MATKMHTEKVMIINEPNSKVSINVTKIGQRVRLPLKDYDFLVKYISSLQQEIAKLQGGKHAYAREVLLGENY